MSELSFYGLSQSQKFLPGARAKHYIWSRSRGKMVLLYNTEYIQQYFVTVLWIRIRMDPEIWPGSRSGSGIKVPDPDPAKSESA